MQWLVIEWEILSPSVSIWTVYTISNILALVKNVYKVLTENSYPSYKKTIKLGLKLKDKDKL